MKDSGFTWPSKRWLEKLISNKGRRLGTRVPKGYPGMKGDYGGS